MYRKYVKKDISLKKFFIIVSKYLSYQYRRYFVRASAIRFIIMRESNYLEMKKEEKPLICLKLKESYTLARNQSSLLHMKNNYDTIQTPTKYERETKHYSNQTQTISIILEFPIKLI